MIEILKYYKILKVSGVDAADFLQQLVTNNIVDKTYSYNFLLNSQGRFVADFFVFKKADNEYLIEIHENLADILIKMLQLYKMRKDVQIEDVSHKYTLLYASHIDKHIFSNIKYISYFQDPRSDKLGDRSIIDISDLDKIKQYITEDNLYLNDKYKYVIPDGFADMIQNKSMPIQYGIDALNAVDYQKGCYVGQEVVSRAKYQGNIRKKIVKGRVVVSSVNPHLRNINSHYPYFSINDLQDNDVVNPIDNDKIGKLCSVYNNDAILLLNTEKIQNLQSNIVNALDQEIIIC